MGQRVSAVVSCSMLASELPRAHRLAPAAGAHLPQPPSTQLPTHLKFLPAEILRDMLASSTSSSSSSSRSANSAGGSCTPRWALAHSCRITSATGRLGSMSALMVAFCRARV